jgi:hypothetical protein
MTMKRLVILLAGVALGALLYQWLVHDRSTPQSTGGDVGALP